MSGSLEADFAFTGHYYHRVSGLHLTLFRSYDSETGRWISRDPIEEDGGLNLYSYVHGNPVNATDPYGQASWYLVGLVLLVAVMFIVLGKASKTSNEFRQQSSNKDTAGGEPTLTPEDIPKITRGIDNLTKLVPSPGSVPDGGTVSKAKKLYEEFDPEYGKAKSKLRDWWEKLKSLFKEKPCPKKAASEYETRIGPNGEIHIGPKAAVQ